MTKICNFPISKTKRCKQPIADDKPNCGRHKTSMSSDQLGQSPTIYRKGGVLHIWAGKPDNVYCLIHSDPAYQTLCQLAGETPPCCLQENTEWKDEHGKLHRNDGPAMIEPNGAQRWYQHGELHRDGGPAWIWLDGTQVWCQHGQPHRDDGPAWTSRDGKQEWYQYGRLHRDGGPAWVLPNSEQRWFQHGQLHRDDGPAAIKADGTQKWYQHGQLHRDDGPAVIWAGGKQDWYWHDEHVTEEEHAKLREQSSGV